MADKRVIDLGPDAGQAQRAGWCNQIFLDALNFLRGVVVDTGESHRLILPGVQARRLG